MKENNNTRYYQLLGEKLKALIVSGNYPIGSRFMPEREIAQVYDVSRAVVREALIMLELENLIVIKKGSGAYIINHPMITDSLMINETSIVNHTDHGPFEVLQARQMLESTIAACAALTITRTDIIELRNILNLEREAVQLGIEVSEENDRNFHFLIAKATHNGMMMDILEQMWNARINSPMWDQLHKHIEDMKFRIKWLDDHEIILNALQKRDPELTRRAMWQHLENVKNTLMELSDFDDPHFDGYLFESIPYETIFETAKES